MEDFATGSPRPSSVQLDDEKLPVNPIDAKRIEKQITYWSKEKGLSIRRAWMQLKDLRTKLVEPDENKASTYTEASLFGFLLEGLGPEAYKTAKVILDLHPNLSRKERLNTLQTFFEENETSESRDLSGLAVRIQSQNRNLSRHRNQYHPQKLSNSPNRQRFLNTDGEETCYICNGQNHHERNCKYRHKARKYDEQLLLEDEARAQSERVNYKSSSHPRSKRDHSKKSVKFTKQTKAIWSDTEPDSGRNDDKYSDLPTESDDEDDDDDEVAALITDELIPIKRRWIKVGGGRLFSDFKGDVLLKCPDGSSGILPDVLLVGGLGVNLLSAKKYVKIIM
ncbi:hypothetical protein OnM2_105027 [Erysiphe neolycopersici]|uniref:Uncharacterized protein n=1 Tax=Erysiphe neolycopersici TaxID=212602 RepID=A0A420H7J8_9PEZI|nr:hypothetical protein OnM2_105027 [Erysiphe neolycopersici]